MGEKGQEAPLVLGDVVRETPLVMGDQLLIAMGSIHKEETTDWGYAVTIEVLFLVVHLLYLHLVQVRKIVSIISSNACQHFCWKVVETGAPHIMPTRNQVGWTLTHKAPHLDVNTAPGISLP